MQSIGYGIVLDHDVATQLPIKSDAQYEYILERGPVLWSPEHGEHVALTVSGNMLLTLSDPSVLIAISQEKDEQTRKLFKEAKQLLRSVIDYQLGSKSLHSRELFVNVAARQQQPISRVAELQKDELNAQETG